MRAHDEHEHAAEARKPTDRTDADRGPAGELLRLQGLAGNRGVTAMLRRDPDAEREEPPTGSPAGAVAEALRDDGRPLDDGLRTAMEDHLGHDFGDVRVHTGPAASTSARALGAHAYTVGRDVVLQGDWDPSSRAGRHTLAHELTHVAQQAAGPVDGTDTGDGLRVSDPGDPFEREADRLADAAVQRQLDEEPVEDETLAAQTSAQRQELPPEPEEEDEEPSA